MATTEHLEVLALVADTKSAVSETDAKARDVAKVYNATCRRYAERGLRTNQKKSKSERAALAKEARATACCGPPLTTTSSKHSPPACVVRGRAQNAHPRDLPPPQPASSYADIDLWLMEQERIGVTGTGETRSNAQTESNGNADVNSYTGICGAVHPICGETPTQFIARFEVIYASWVQTCEANGDVIQYCDRSELFVNHRFTNVTCGNISFAHVHRHIVMLSRTFMFNNNMVGNWVVTDKLLTQLGLLPGNRQTSTSSDPVAQCSFHGRIWPYSECRQELSEFLNIVAYEHSSGKVKACKICACRIFFKKGVFYHPANQTEESQLADAEDYLPRESSPGNEKGKQREKDDTSQGPTVVPPPPASPPPARPSSNSGPARRPLLGKELTQVEIERMLYYDGRPGYYDSITVQRAIRRYKGDTRLCTELTIDPAAFDYAVVLVDYDCINIPLPLCVISLLWAFTSRSWTTVTRLISWRVISPAVVGLLMYVSWLWLFSLTFRVVEITTGLILLARFADAVVHSQTFRRFTVRRRLAYIPHLVSCVAVDASIGAGGMAFFDSVSNRLRQVTSFPVQDATVADELYASALAVMAHLDVRDFRVPVAGDPNLTYVDSFTPFMDLPRDSKPADSSQDSKSTHTATGSQKPPFRPTPMRAASRPASPSGLNQSGVHAARTSDNSPRASSPDSDHSASTAETPKPSAAHSSSASRDKPLPKMSEFLRTSSPSFQQKSFHYSPHYHGSSRSKSGFSQHRTRTNKRKASDVPRSRTTDNTPEDVNASASAHSSNLRNTATGKSGGSSIPASMPSRHGADPSSNQ